MVEKGGQLWLTTSTLPEPTEFPSMGAAQAALDATEGLVYDDYTILESGEMSKWMKTARRKR